MKRISLTLSILLILFAGGIWGEANKEVSYKMLPLQPPSDNLPETAKGLMRCLQLYTTYFLITLEACGFNDWKKKNNSGHKGFTESKQFKECRSYEDHKLRDEYSLKFMQEAHKITYLDGTIKRESVEIFLEKLLTGHKFEPIVIDNQAYALKDLKGRAGLLIITP